MPTWLLNLLGTGTGGLISTIASFIPNPEERAKAEMALQAQIVNAYIAADADQRAINKVEASSPSLFIAGWRPAAGWLCVFGLAWQFFVSPMLTWVAVLIYGKYAVPLPTLGDSTLTDLLYALLGIGGLRTIDKATGKDTLAVAKNNIVQLFKKKAA